MVEIPGFFNKVDFYGVVLPGYVAVVLYLLLFHPEIFFGAKPELVVDLFLATVFLVAGPAAGLTLQHLHRYLYSFMGLLGRPKDRERRRQIVRDYARIRLKMSAEEKLELDQAEANYDFSMSTALVLFLLFFVAIAKGALDPYVRLLLLVAGVVFVVGGWLERKETYSPLFHEIIKRAQKQAEPVHPEE